MSQIPESIHDTNQPSSLIKVQQSPGLERYEASKSWVFAASLKTWHYTEVEIYMDTLLATLGGT